MPLELLLFSTKASPLTGWPSLNSSHVSTMKEASKIIHPTKAEVKHGHQFKDRTGQKYGQLTVISFAGRGVRNLSVWNCSCECGRECMKYGSQLATGRNRSCGHLQGNPTHDTDHFRRTHPEYTVLLGMIARCSKVDHHNYLRYGARGIKVCAEWNHPSKFLIFYADMGPRPTPEHRIERIDNDGDYRPENCKWATMREQARNKRDNHMITFRGETLCLMDTAHKFGLNHWNLRDRLKKGWDLETAITTPIRTWKK